MELLASICRMYKSRTEELRRNSAAHGAERAGVSGVDQSSAPPLQ